MLTTQEVFYKVRNLFIYIPDQEQFNIPDDWRSHADEVDNNQVFRDDCDGFSMTCAEVLVRNDINKDLIKLVYCLIETGDGHLVCVVDNKLLDNRQRYLWNWSDVPYTWVSYMKMSEPGIWRSIKS
jgi:predicted transglutaminase-like cysteine proteinase